MSAVVAAIALGVGPPSGTPPTLSGTPAGQLSLNGGTPFSVSSFQWGAGVGVSNSNPPVISPPSLSEITVTKGYDANSVTLANDLVGKTIIPTVRIALNWSDATLVYDFTNVVVSGDSVSSGGGQPSESVSLNYGNIKWTYTDASGTTSGSGTTRPSS